jgi:hypothetical protein
MALPPLIEKLKLFYFSSTALYNDKKSYKGGCTMFSKKVIIGTVLFSSLLLSTQSLASSKQSENAYWGASGTASCYNHKNISVWVGMSYTHHNEALAELWTKAVTACLDKGGLYDVSGAAYSHQGPSW